MKYIISESKLDDIIYKYLDLNLKGLEKRNPRYYKGIILSYPEEEYGVMGYENEGVLYILYKIVDEISVIFGLTKLDSQSVIGRWFSDRYKLQVINTPFVVHNPYGELSIDTN